MDIICTRCLLWHRHLACDGHNLHQMSIVAQASCLWHRHLTCGTGILPVMDIICTRCLFVNFCNILHKLSKGCDIPVSTHRQINYEETRHTPKTRPGKFSSPRDRFKPIAIFRAVSPESYRDNLIPDNKTITY